MYGLSRYAPTPTPTPTPTINRQKQLDRALLALQVKHEPIRLDTLITVATATALQRGCSADSNDPVTAYRWAVEYARDYRVQVGGMQRLRYLGIDSATAWELSAPIAYALIADVWPELAPYCPVFTWRWAQQLLRDATPSIPLRIQ